MTAYYELLELLEKHVSMFEELAATEQAKLEAARERDILKLEEYMKKEQADTLALRGYDKRRLKLQEDLNLKDLTFKQMLPLLPEEVRYEFQEVYRRLTEAYQIYKTNSGCAKRMIEINLHRVGIALEALREKSRQASGKVYSPDGAVNADHHTFKDMKV